MLRFIIRRVLLAFVTLFAISVTTFALFFAGPADPASLMCGQRICSQETTERINRILGLDQPIPTQYVQYMKGIFLGRQIGDIECPAPCLGVSFRTREPVLRILGRAAPVTISIALGSAVIYLVVGVGLGMISAIRMGTYLDRAAVGLSLVFASMQVFFLGLLLLYIFVYGYGWLPRPQYHPITENPLKWAGGMIVPWLTIGLLSAAVYARFSRAQMLETLSEDYVRTAKAKGASNLRVNFKHAFRAAVTPIVTIAGLDIGGQLGGLVITESTFSMLGIGRQAVNAVNTLNLPIIMATVLIAAVAVVVANLVVDVSYAVIDPRVRLS